MYRNSYQRGMLTVFYSVGSKPLAIWETHTKDGYITRFLDQDIKSMVLEIGGTNVSTTYITCPKGNQVLGITMPFLVMIVKNLKKYFSFEVTILDETLTRRRFRVSNFQSNTQILPLCTVMPIGLSDGWNQIQFNLGEFTRRAYKKQFVEVQKLKINANIRLRRIYFTERLIPDDELPPEYKLYFPLTSKGAKGKKNAPEPVSGKENIKPSSSQHTQITVQTDTKTMSKVSLHSIKKTQSIEKSVAGGVEEDSEKKVVEENKNDIETQENKEGLDNQEDQEKQENQVSQENQEIEPSGEEKQDIMLHDEETAKGEKETKQVEE
ncbi:cilia- and flagella-associated protein 20-like [Danaus plexippus]|uniref:cilia- and flagella-associated protein 20-like n=1 Tax=Danaus plexippus TaxID=13037 RepID=UPI002AB1A5CF|nr:cilia- and flagella-associated protein 20-like [Danaus plexippus]